LRNRRRLEDSSNELFLLAGEHELKYMRARGTLYRGGALVLSERFAEAVPLLEEGIAHTRTMRNMMIKSQCSRASLGLLISAVISDAIYPPAPVFYEG
jgi:hypothetical protein